MILELGCVEKQQLQFILHDPRKFCLHVSGEKNSGYSAQTKGDKQRRGRKIRGGDRRGHGRYRNTSV